MKAARDWLGRRLLPPGRGGYRAIPGPAPKRLPPPPPPTSHTSSMRRKWAEELATKFDRQVQIAQCTPEDERSGVREGMIVTWIAAAKAVREYGETKPPCPCGQALPCALTDTGYPWCTRCASHHRHPETCEQDDGETAPLKTPAEWCSQQAMRVLCGRWHRVTERSQQQCLQTINHQGLCDGETNP